MVSSVVYLIQNSWKRLSHFMWLDTLGTQPKRFGVDSRLLEELKTCQFNRRKKSNMFERSAIVSVNNLRENELMVRATRRRLTIVSTWIRNVRPPVQVIDEIDERTVEIVIDITSFVRIRFSSATDTYKRL
jgi:hypothetical protein